MSAPTEPPHPVDIAAAREVLQLAELAEASRVTPDEGPVGRLRARGGDIVEAAELLLLEDPAAALRLVSSVVGYWLDEGRVDIGRQLTDRVICTVGWRDEPDVQSALPRALVCSGRARVSAGRPG